MAIRTRLSVLVVALVFVVGQTLADDEKPYVAFANYRIDPRNSEAPDVEHVSSGDGQSFDNDETMPDPSFRGVSTSEVTGPRGYLYHWEQFKLDPQVSYMVADVKAKFHSYLRKEFENEVKAYAESEKGEDEAEAATEIRANYHTCLMNMRANAVRLTEAAIHCGKYLWEQTKQKFAVMEYAMKKK